MRTTKKSKIAVGIVTISLFLSSFLAWADDVFVDCRNTTGPWDGSIDHPYQSIQDAIDANTTYDGDNIRVSDCTYEEGIVVNKFLNIYGSGPDVTTIDATNVVGKDYALWIEENMEVTIRGFRIVNPINGVMIRPNSETVIANNIINAENGINANSACGANVTIMNNTIDSCTQDGVYLKGCVGVDITGKLYNNIITSNSRYGIYVERTNLTNSYNDVWNNGTNYGGYASPGTESISENPRFVDPTTGNYRLLLASPCIDRGWPIKTQLDPDGSRNNMGAYGGPGAAIFWPDSPGAPVVTDLTVTPAAVPTDGTVTIKAVGRVRPYSPGQE